MLINVYSANSAFIQKMLTFDVFFFADKGTIKILYKENVFFAKYKIVPFAMFIKTVQNA